MTHTTATSRSFGPLTTATSSVATGPLMVAVGGTDSDSALRAAHTLGHLSPQGIMAVAVLEPIPAYAIGSDAVLLPPSFEEERQAALLTQVTRQVDAVKGSGESWNLQVIYGDPPVAISDLARSLHSPMIIMGIGRHRPLDRLLGAETSLRTIRRAPCPVLAVHSGHVGPFHEAVLATDFSPASARAAELVLPMLAKPATLHLVHVWQPAATEDTRLGASDAAYAKSIGERFQRFTGLLKVPEGVTIKLATREGKPAERVLDVAQAHHADLIIAGRRGLNAVSRFLVGSVTTAIVRGATCSVLVTPEPPFTEIDRLRRLLSGVSQSTDPKEWTSQLENFTARNRGRTTRLEVEDLAFGAQVKETGYLLRNVSFHPDDRRVEIVLGDAAHSARQVTRSIAMVDEVSVVTDASGKDVGLRISHGGGETALGFEP